MSKYNLETEQSNIKWKDRKRHMGMPLSFTKYYVDDDRLYIEKGFFKTTTDEILLYRILDIKTIRTFWQKIFGVGTINLYSADQNNRTLELKNIKKPKQVHKFLSNLVEHERVARNIVGREIVGTGIMDMDHIDGDCDLCDDTHEEN